VLAKRTHAPGLSALLEIGVMNMSPIDTAVGLADARIWYRATCLSGFLDVMGMNVHRGVVDVGFLGALEIDRFGNINTTLVKDDSGKVRYVNGSAGGNDIASHAKRVIMIMRHEKRKLPEAVAHLTSPGFVGGRSRRESNLRGGGPHRLITDMAARLEDVVENTGFALHIPQEVPSTPLPSEEELRLLREEIDPKGVYLR